MARKTTDEPSPGWAVAILCSDPRCEGEEEVFVADLDEAELVACPCGSSMVIAAVAEFVQEFGGRPG